MRIEGYKLIYEAVEPFGGEPIPRPGEDENLAFVTVEFPEDVQPAFILNALEKASLAYRKPSRKMAVNYDPNLEVVASGLGSLTFHDTTIPSIR